MSKELKMEVFASKGPVKSVKLHVEFLKMGVDEWKK